MPFYLALVDSQLWLSMSDNQTDWLRSNGMRQLYLNSPNYPLLLKYIYGVPSQPLIH